jgi:hypothetical protein
MSRRPLSETDSHKLPQHSKNRRYAKTRALLHIIEVFSSSRRGAEHDNAAAKPIPKKDEAFAVKWETQTTTTVLAPQERRAKKGRTFKIFLVSRKTKTSIQRKVIDDTSSVYYVSRHESSTPQNTPKTKKKSSEISQGSPTASFVSRLVNTLDMCLGKRNPIFENFSKTGFKYHPLIAAGMDA